MLDNTEVIGKLGPVKPMSEADKQMLKKYSSVIGRHMCRYLRHDPELIDLKMDKRAWVNASELIQKFNAQYRGKKFYLNLPVLIEIVKTDNKQRYGVMIRGHELMIRCRQGHSIPWIEMDYEQASPPDKLFHGTIDTHLNSIMKEGLKPMARNHVHLSADLKTAKAVAGRRRGQATKVILSVDTAQMREDGFVFYLSENCVWLTDHVPPKYLQIAEWVSTADN